MATKSESSESSNSSGIFISWSGELSRIVAEELRTWLPFNLDGLDLWISSEDLTDGKRWSIELFKQLECKNFGVLVVTPDSIVSPWMMFEAGALSKDLSNGRVVPYLVGLKPSELQGPLKHFQSITADKAGTLRMVKAINKASKNGASEEVISDRFQYYWPKFSDFLDRLDIAGHMDRVVARNPEEDSIERLEKRLSETTDMIRELTNAWSPRPESIPHKTSDDIPGEISLLEGAWASAEATIYARVIAGELHAPYRYGAMDILTGVHYNWKRVGDYWFARFKWVDVDFMHGFGIYRMLSDNVLEGEWWLDEDTDPNLLEEKNVGIGMRPGGTKVRFERREDYEVPEWAERYFASINVD